MIQYFILNLKVMQIFLFKARELVSSEYYIWNTTGDAPVASGPLILQRND